MNDAAPPRENPPTHPATPTRGDRRNRTSLGTFARASMGSAMIVLLGGIIVVTISFSNVLSAREEVFERYEPALVQTERLRTSLLDQETGVRGFAQTRDLRFLQPYLDGQEDELGLTASLHRLLDEAGDGAGARRIDEVTEESATWRSEVAQPIIDAPPIEGPDPAVLRSKEAFDVVRASVDALELAVERGRSAARADLDVATTSLAVAIGVALAGVTIAGVLAGVVLRRRVIQPIERLVAQTEAVELGRFDTVIDVTGPLEIEQLAQRVDQMRSRLVEEIAAVDAARAALDAQSRTLERSNRDLEQFAYVASHDLQEPLRKVASFCQLLDQRYRDQLDDKGKLYIEYAVDGAKRMQALISGLLDFSRVGRNTDSFVECDLDALMAGVVQHSSERITEAGADIRWDGLPTVTGDPALLAGLLQNLLGNALKYRRPEVNPVVEVSARSDGDRWEIAFDDNGIGIDEDFRERVFVIFQRLHGRDAFEGTGIGLALCKKIVEFHGGDIWIGPAPPTGGTSVRWTLPAAIPVNAGYAPDDARSPDEDQP